MVLHAFLKDANKKPSHRIWLQGGLCPAFLLCCLFGALENTFLSYLIEDKTRHGMSHVEMLCHVHKKIQQKMNEYD